MPLRIANDIATGSLCSHWTSRRDRLDLDPHKPPDLSWVPENCGSSSQDQQIVIAFPVFGLA